MQKSNAEWSGKTVLELALELNLAKFFEIPVVGDTVADIWFGKIKRSTGFFHLVSASLIPPLAQCIEFKERDG